MSTRSRKRKRFLKRGAHREEMTLQITAMADIFTVLLVFLLKSFSSGITQITPTADLMLPIAEAKDAVVTVLKLEIAKDSLLLDDKPLLTLAEFKFNPSDLESDGTPRALNAALVRERNKKPLNFKKTSRAARAKAGTTAETPELDPENDPENFSKIMLLADQNTPYAVLKRIMDTAANHGFSDFKLVVVEDQ